MRNLAFSVRTVSGVLALLLGLTFVAPPAQAGEATASIPTRPHKATLAAAAAAKVERTDTAAAVLATQGTTSTEASDRSFFKTPKGAVTLILMVAGTGYAIYSKSHDRVRSPAR